MTLDPLMAAPPIVQAHVALALLSVLLGPPALFRRRRDRWHRLLGRAWVAAMAGTALSSFLITETRSLGPFSMIHILSVLTLIGLWEGVAHARAGRIAEHRRAMLTVFSGAIGGAGLFIFFPGGGSARPCSPPRPGPGSPASRLWSPSGWRWPGGARRCPCAKAARGEPSPLGRRGGLVYRGGAEGPVRADVAELVDAQR